MSTNNCELCSFENPRLTATAIVIRDGKILVAQRNEEPFKGQWDFLGGYLHTGETPEQCLRRELAEEIGLGVLSAKLIDTFPGTASYREHNFPILSFAYLTELEDGTTRLNGENTALGWVPLCEMQSIAFDSNEKILKHLQEKFVYDIATVRSLVAQLDPAAVFSEQSLYKAILEGYVSAVYEQGTLIGMGWIFPRQTMLRRQAVVEDMIVDQSRRGRGLGEKILLDLLQWAKGQGIEVVELTTNPRRVAANALYQKVGFRLHETNHYLLELKTQ